MFKFCVVIVVIMCNFSLQKTPQFIIFQCVHLLPDNYLIHYKLFVLCAYFLLNTCKLLPLLDILSSLQITY